MSLYLATATGFVAGTLLGLLYFGGLWWTVERLNHAEHPIRWGLLSFAVRTAGALAGFYLLLGLGGAPTAVALLGFLAGRTIWMQRIAPRAGTGALEEGPSRT